MKKLRFKILKTTFYKIFANILGKYLTSNLSTLKLNLNTSLADYNKIIDELQDELKSKDHFINKLLTTIGDLTTKCKFNKRLSGNN